MHRMDDIVSGPHGESVPTIRGVRNFYRSGEDVVLEDLSQDADHVIARRADGTSVFAQRVDSYWTLVLTAGTYTIEVFDVAGDLLEEELTTVGRHQGERPVHGFATSFLEGDVDEIVDWHRSLRTTVVQVYDWMSSYTAPLGASPEWQDPSHRPVSLTALQRLASQLGAMGAVTHAYAPIYAVGNDFATANPEMLLYEDDGAPIRFLDQIVIANPSDPRWQEHFVRAYGEAMDAIGFDGLHVDTYGYPRLAFDATGAPVDMRAAYEAFLRHLREGRPDDLISFNQVNGVPSSAKLPGGPWFRYCEIWPPNVAWRHFEGLLDRSSGRAGLVPAVHGDEPTLRGSLACYPPVWSVNHSTILDDEPSRQDSLRTVLLTDAIATMLATSALIYGDKSAALCDPYYPKHATLSAEESKSVIRWRRFALRCRDLFIEGEDTSWYEINDENGAVAITAEHPVAPEPLGGSIFARVFQGTNIVTVALLDLTGSESGLWSQPSAAGRARAATVRVLLANPENWRVDTAILGLDQGRFSPRDAQVVGHRQGRALEIEVPLGDGWAVVRLTPTNGLG